MDLTLILMQQLIRVTYFAWAINDSVAPQEKLTQAAKDRILRETPTILEFLSYNFNFLGLLCPSVDFFDYMEWIRQRGNYIKTPMKKDDHIRVSLSIAIAIVSYILSTIFLYSAEDLLTDSVRNKVVLTKIAILY
jgi:ABC-type amino acid transport system permease subunit